MDTTVITQELLLNLNSSFCKREWCEKKDGSPMPAAASDRLKTICWDGMLPDLLPEICLKDNNKPLILWEMMGTSHLLHLKLGGYQQRLENEFALHPYLIKEYTCWN